MVAKRIRMTLSGLALAAAAGLFVTPARAEGMEVKAKVPFSFYAGNEMFPAGSYVFTVDDASAPTVLTIENAKDHGKRTEFVLTEGEKMVAGPAEQSELLFDRYGQDNFLAEVQVQGMDEGRALPETSRERQCADAHMTKHRVTVHPGKAS